jgi:hypothetical protein
MNLQAKPTSTQGHTIITQRLVLTVCLCHYVTIELEVIGQLSCNNYTKCMSMPNDMHQEAPAHNLLEWSSTDDIGLSGFKFCLPFH